MDASPIDPARPDAPWAADGLRMDVRDHIARIVIDRPAARNAVTGEMLQAMAAFVDGVKADATVRAVLITGAGEHFMAGGDVKSFAGVLDHDPEALRADFMRRSKDAEPLWLALEELPQPVVCSVRGFAAGAALSFVAGADVAIASETAKFVLAHVGLGLVADAATTYHLPRLIGLRRAKELAFFGERIDAQEALRIGLVSRVTPDDRLEAETEAVLDRLVRAPATSLTAAKRLMNASLANTLTQQLAMEGQAVGACAATSDLKEGVRAFVEKRKPVFGGG